MKVKVLATATVANVSCGFDALGFALCQPYDEMEVRLTHQRGVVIKDIKGEFNLPYEPEKNVAGVALLAMLDKIEEPNIGFELSFNKIIKPGSGIGSSSASAAGAVVAANELINRRFSKLELVAFAMEGERVASGSAHADNVAPAIFGGFTLVRSNSPLDVVSLPTPQDMYATVLHPLIEVKTSDARKILKTQVSLRDAVTQWSNVGGLVAGLFLSDYELIARSLHDVIIEPTRAILIPYFDELKKSGLDAGALGGGISGSGPSVFMLSKGENTAKRVAEAMQAVYKPTDIPFEIHISAINEQGVLVV